MAPVLGSIDCGAVRPVGEQEAASHVLELSVVVEASTGGERLSEQVDVHVGLQREAEPRLHGQSGAVREGEEIPSPEGRLCPTVSSQHILARVYVVLERGRQAHLPARLGHERDTAIHALTAAPELVPADVRSEAPARLGRAAITQVEGRVPAATRTHRGSAPGEPLILGSEVEPGRHTCRPEVVPSHRCRPIKRRLLVLPAQIPLAVLVDGEAIAAEIPPGGRFAIRERRSPRDTIRRGDAPDVVELRLWRLEVGRDRPQPVPPVDLLRTQRSLGPAHAGARRVESDVRSVGSLEVAHAGALQAGDRARLTVYVREPSA